MQKRSIFQDNSDVTKQSLSSISPVKVRGHFGNVFVKPSAVFPLFTFLLLFKAQKEKFQYKFPLRMAEEKMCKSYFISPLKVQNNCVHDFFLE